MTASSSRERTRRARLFVWAMTGSIILALGVLVYTVAQSMETRKQIEDVVAAAPCEALAQAGNEGASPRQIGALSAECSLYLNGLGPLIRLRFACAIIREAGYRCPAPRESNRDAADTLELAPPLGPSAPSLFPEAQTLPDEAEPSPVASEPSPPKKGGSPGVGPGAPPAAPQPPSAPSPTPKSPGQSERAPRGPIVETPALPVRVCVPRLICSSD